MTPLCPSFPASRRCCSTANQLARRLLALLMMVGLAVTIQVGSAGGEGTDDIEVRVAKADGFTYRELEPVRPIVMFPISVKAAGANHASRLSNPWGDVADPSRFVAPGQVEKLIRSGYLATAYDSLVTTMATVQPASSLALLNRVANHFSARHALVPVDVVIDGSDDHYALDAMFVLVDLKSGHPRLIMSAGNTLAGKEAAKSAPQAEVATQTFRAVLTALRERT